MSTLWIEEGIIIVLGTRIKKLKFADRVQMIQKLLKLAVEALDGMEAEAAKECP